MKGMLMFKSKMVWLAVLAMMTSSAFAEELVKNSNGDEIILRDDFTWKYVEPETPKAIPSSYVRVSLTGMSKTPLFDCSLKTVVFVGGVKLMNLTVSDYFNYYDEDGDAIPRRGFGNRTLFINETIKDGETYKKNTFSDDVDCSEISYIVFEPVLGGDPDIRCQFAGETDSEDCSELFDNMIGTKWDVVNGRIATFQDSLSRDDIKRIQSLLNERGFNAGKPDGAFGRGSKRALMDFEESVGRPKSGELTKEILVELGFYDK